MPFNFPIFLTWLRIVLIPLVVGVFYLSDTIVPLHQKNTIAALIFLLAALTDLLDGYLARKLNQTSAFGAFLDPVADKLMVSAALLILVELSRINAAIALIIIGREITISALREWMAQMGASKNVAVNWLGKVKTISQMVAIPMLLYNTPISLGLHVENSAPFLLIHTRVWGVLLIYLAAFITIWSMLYYLKLAWPLIKQRSES